MPIPISRLFNIPPEALDAAGVFDAFVDLDSQLHVDPHLLVESSAPEMHDARAALTRFFEELIVLLESCTTQEGALWGAVVRRLRLKELRGVSLGYSRGEGDGAAIGPGLAERLADRAYQIVRAGVKNPLIFELVGLFTEAFGPDRISDIVLRVAQVQFAKYSERIALSLGIPTSQVTVDGQSVQLPFHTLSGRQSAIYLVPKDVLRELPVALSPEDITAVVAYNEAMRDKLNELFASVGVASRAPSKSELWDRIENDPDLLKVLLEAYVSAGGSPYDFALDPGAEARRFLAARALASQHPLKLSVPSSGWTPDSALVTVQTICEHFKNLVENNGLWDSFWISKKPAKTLTERAIQRIFFGIALTYCRDNSPDLDISPETNAGPGPVDFKFSHGSIKVTLEMKKSSHGRLLHGYKTQLERYNAAENTNASIFLIVRVGDHVTAINNVLTERDSAMKAGQDAPVVIVVDARPQQSASKA